LTPARQPLALLDRTQVLGHTSRIVSPVADKEPREPAEEPQWRNLMAVVAPAIFTFVIVTRNPCFPGSAIVRTGLDCSCVKAINPWVNDRVLNFAAPIALLVEQAS